MFQSLSRDYSSSGKVIGAFGVRGSKSFNPSPGIILLRGLYCPPVKTDRALTFQSLSRDYSSSGANMGRGSRPSGQGFNPSPGIILLRGRVGYAARLAKPQLSFNPSPGIILLRGRVKPGGFEHRWRHVSIPLQGLFFFGGLFDSVARIACFLVHLRLCSVVSTVGGPAGRPGRFYVFSTRWRSFLHTVQPAKSLPCAGLLLCSCPARLNQWLQPFWLDLAATSTYTEYAIV